MIRRVRRFVLGTLTLVCFLLLSQAAFAFTREGGFDSTSWMRYLPDSMQVSEINIPGTHDTVSTFMRAIYADFGQCQEWTLPEQMDNGLRFFDIRLESDEDNHKDWFQRLLHHHGTHNGFNCYKESSNSNLILFSDILGYAKSFLKAHPTETVIFMVVADHNYNDVQPDLLHMLDYWHYDRPVSEEDPYGYIKCYKVGERVPTMGEARGNLIIILDENNHDYSLTTYEMEYKLKFFDIKTALVLQVFDTANQNEYRIDYLGRRGAKFIEEPYKNVIWHEGNPFVKHTGTNMNSVYDFGSAFDGYNPKVSAYEFKRYWNAWGGNNHIESGNRYGWITMDFPDREMIYHICLSNYDYGMLQEFEGKIYFEQGVSHSDSAVYSLHGRVIDTGEEFEFCSGYLRDLPVMTDASGRSYYSLQKDSVNRSDAWEHTAYSNILYYMEVSHANDEVVAVISREREEKLPIYNRISEKLTLTVEVKKRGENGCSRDYELRFLKDDPGKRPGSFADFLKAVTPGGMTYLVTDSTGKSERRTVDLDPRSPELTLKEGWSFDPSADVWYLTLHDLPHYDEYGEEYIIHDFSWSIADSSYVCASGEVSGTNQVYLSAQWMHPYIEQRNVTIRVDWYDNNNPQRKKLIERMLESEDDPDGHWYVKYSFVPVGGKKVIRDTWPSYYKTFGENMSTFLFSVP
ncbi:MAG: hypothetical protein MJ136_02190 [Clostridia bacterium]|nr:hypothetical protein [Clostridia bacterium]